MNSPCLEGIAVGSKSRLFFVMRKATRKRAKGWITHSDVNGLIGSASSAKAD